MRNENISRTIVRVSPRRAYFKSTAAPQCAWGTHSHTLLHTDISILTHQCFCVWVCSLFFKFFFDLHSVEKLFFLARWVGLAFFQEWGRRWQALTRRSRSLMCYPLLSKITSIDARFSIRNSLNASHAPHPLFPI